MDNDTSVDETDNDSEPLIQRTCWAAGGQFPCLDCGTSCPVITDGQYEWISCQKCNGWRTVSC